MRSFDDIVGLLRAAAEPTRLRILNLLLSGEFNVKDLTQLLGQSQPRVSRHIRLLAEAGLIERYQEGSWVFVRAPSDPVIRDFVRTALGHDRRRTMRSSCAMGSAHRNPDQARGLLLNPILMITPLSGIASVRFHVAEGDVEQAILEALGPGPYELLLHLGAGTGRVLELGEGSRPSARRRRHKPRDAQVQKASVSTGRRAFQL